MPDHGHGLTKAPPLSVEHVTVELREKVTELEKLNEDLCAENEELWGARYDLGFEDGYKAGRDEALENAY